MINKYITFIFSFSFSLPTCIVKYSDCIFFSLRVLMAFAPISPLTTDGLNKFLSMTYHQYINCATYTFAELRVA
jgi:hypothetical protein